MKSQDSAHSRSNSTEYRGRYAVHSWVENILWIIYSLAAISSPALGFYLWKGTYDVSYGDDFIWLFIFPCLLFALFICVVPVLIVIAIIELF